MLFFLTPAINNARGAIGWEWFHRSVKTFSPFSSTRAEAHTPAVKELPFEPCTVTRRDLERVPRLRLHRMQHLTHLSSSSRVTAWNHLRGAHRDTLNNERDLLLFSFYFSTIRSNARAHAVWPREGEDREGRRGEGRGGSKGVTF